MPTEWKVGDRLESRWEIHKILRGGMGVVYIVHDHQWNEALAAKTFQDEVFARSPSIAPMFTREALAWVQLDAHPNIAQALFVQEIEGKPVLFLEYVSGGDLSGWIGTPRLTEDLPQVLRFAVAFCDGMIHSRSKGIQAHRDIKPQNCLITEYGALKITDFGLAKVFDDAGMPALGAGGLGSGNPGALALSHTGNAAGTCTHMPPEQFVDSKHVGVEADVYSFGVMLFQMLVGRLPFTGRTWDDFERAHRSQPAPVEDVKHAAMRGILERCLAKQPSQRWQDFAQLREPLAALYQQLTGSAPPRPRVGEELNTGQWLNKGVSLAALGLRDQALACYEKALAINPRYAEVWLNKGNLIRDGGRLEEALACYDEALASDPRIDLIWYNKGATLETLGRTQEALECLDRALAINPLIALAWSSRGVALDKLGRFEESLTSYDGAIRLHPRFAAAWVNKGNLLRRLLRPEEALVCHEKALEIHATLPEAWYNKANVLSDLKRYDEAQASYEKALAIHPRFASAWLGKGNVFTALAQPKLALSCYERGLELNPRDANGWYNKAVTLVKLDRREEALAAFDQSLEINSRDADVWTKKGDALEVLGRNEESYACYVTATFVNPGDALAWHNRAVKSKALGRLDEALTCHEKALAIDPAIEEGWHGKANVLADLGRADEAFAAYDRALELNPRFASAWFSKGATLGNADRFREALECFERAQELGHPQAAKAAAVCRQNLGEAAAPAMDAGAWHNKGAELAEQGHPAEALECFEHALALSPHSTVTLYGKAVALGKLGRHEEALASYDRAVTIYPEFALAWYSRGVTLLSAFKRTREALDCFEKAHKLGYASAAQAIAVCQEALAKEAPSAQPQNAEAWHSKGAELDQQGRPAEALACFDKALSIGGFTPATLFGKAVVLGKLGRQEEELVCYDQALAIFPGFAGAWFNKGRTLGGYFKRYREALECFEKAQKLGHPMAAQGIAICQKGLSEGAAFA